MDDLIYRWEAIEEINRFRGYLDEDMLFRLSTALKRLPPAQRWISEPEIEALAGMPADVVAIALLYARHMVNDGVDVCEKWETATQQQAAFDAAYRRGRYDEWKRWVVRKEEP